MLFLDHIEECKLYKETYQKNRDICVEVLALLSEEGNSSLRSKLIVLTKPTETIPNNAWILFGRSTSYIQMHNFFVFAYRFILMGYYKPAKVMLRISLENLFRILYLHSRPSDQLHFLKNNKNLVWLREGTIKSHYTNSIELQKKLLGLSDELSLVIHSKPSIDEEGRHHLLMENQLVYDKKQFDKTINLFKKTHSICLEMIEYEISKSNSN